MVWLEMRSPRLSAVSLLSLPAFAAALPDLQCPDKPAPLPALQLPGPVHLTVQIQRFFQLRHTHRQVRGRTAPGTVTTTGIDLHHQLVDALLMLCQAAPALPAPCPELTFFLREICNRYRPSEHRGDCRHTRPGQAVIVTATLQAVECLAQVPVRRPCTRPAG